MRRLATLLACASATLAEPVHLPPSFIHHVQGKVFLDGRPIDDVRPGLKLSQFHTLGKGSTLSTGLGLAEVMMAPGLVLRVGENSELVLVSPDRGAVVQVNKGAIAIDAAEIKDTLTIRHADSTLTVRKAGGYWVGGSPMEARVYDGQADLVRDGARRTLRRGQALAMTGASDTRRIDLATTNSLMRWSRQRGHYVGMASAASAWGLWSAHSPWLNSGWYFNPYYGMFGFIPHRGRSCSWCGTCYYSPGSVQVAYSQPTAVRAGGADSRVAYGYDANNGYATSSQRSFETQTPPPSSTTPTATTAPASTETRSGESSAGRRGEGGGRSQ
jgi:hypothetical protein